MLPTRLTAALLTLAAALACTGVLAQSTPLPPPAATSFSAGTLLARTAGSGRYVDERRTPGRFTAVRSRVPFDVELRAADEDAVIVQIDDNLTALIETRVVPGLVPTLEIALAPDAALRSARQPRVVVLFSALEAVTLDGSGNLHADRIVGPHLAVALAGSGNVRIDKAEVKAIGLSISGSGDLRVAGQADQQAIRIAGSGDVEAAELAGRAVQVSIAGSGDATVNASETLSVAIAGSGDVRYRGAPKLAQRIAGSGSVAPLR